LQPPKRICQSEKMSAQKRIILVCGPHRSGTSAITKSLEVLGVSLGATLMPPDTSNEKGYWEDPDFYALNQEMLASTGRDWHHLKPLDEPEITLLHEAYFQRASRLLKEKSGSTELLGVKDPRFSLLLAFWKNVFKDSGIEASYVIAIRHPLSVAASLAVRDRLPEEKSHWLWISHLLGCLVGTEKCERIIVEFDELLRNPAIQIGRLANALRLDVREDRLRDFRESFLDPSLNHAGGCREKSSPDPACAPLAMEIYQSLHLIATGRQPFTGPDYEQALAKWQESFYAVQSLLTLTQKNDLAIDILATAATERNRRIELLSGEKDRLLRNLEAQAAKRRESRAKIRQMTKDALDRQSDIESLQASNSEMQGALDSVEIWQRSWRRRAFTRWHRFRIHANAGAPRRLERSIRNFRKKLLALLSGKGAGGAGDAPEPFDCGLPIPEERKDRAPGEMLAPDDYHEWIKTHDTLDDAVRSSIRNSIAALKDPPLISVVMPTYNTKAAWLEGAIESVQNQLYPHWELCIADDASTQEHVRKILERYQSVDARIRVIYRESTGHISRASNSAIAIAQGAYVALLDHDDVLAEHALAYVALAAAKHPGAQIFYSDEDKLSPQGLRVEPHFKSDWNPDLFYSQNYICHLSVFRGDLLAKVRSFRVGVEGSQDQDLLLRCLPHVTGGQIIHIPHILYHWRILPGSTALEADGKDYTTEAGLKALNDHFDENGPQGVRVENGGVPNTYRVRWPLPSPAPLVSILIPTRDRLELIETVTYSILDKTSYRNFEILILDNGSIEDGVSKFYKEIQSEDSRVRVLSCDGPFNFSAINNSGVAQARGSVIGFINNDIEVISREWLGEMVAHAIRPDIGCVGAKLYYSDGRIQHGGVIVGLGGVAGHSHKYFPRKHPGYFSRLLLAQSLSAVTAACMLVRREVFDQVGGLDQHLQVAFNDVDFCLKVREKGYRNVWTPYAGLYHHESLSRGVENSPEKRARFESEVRFMLEKWGSLLERDPFYNPNLTLDREDFGLSLLPPHAEDFLRDMS